MRLYATIALAGPAAAFLGAVPNQDESSVYVHLRAHRGDG